MMSELIPGDVRKFILEHIDSVAALEALLLLRKDPDQHWTIETVSERLYVDSTTAASVLGRLASGGLCTRSGNSYRYQPSGDEKRMLVDRLAEAYGQYLIPVTNFIHDKPTRIRHFADAFRLRRDK